MQDMIVLGFLKIKSMTSYDLKKAMEKSTSFFYNASLGSINPALKKNENAGYVTVSEGVENGRARKHYTITASGISAFQSWLHEDINISKIKDEAMLKLFFLGNLSDTEQKLLISNYIKTIEAELTQLELKQSNSENCEIPKGAERLAEFQLATLEFGVDYYRFTLQWYKKRFKALLS